jgi:hypothetical protein
LVIADGIQHRLPGKAVRKSVATDRPADRLYESERGRRLETGKGQRS